MTNHVFLIDSTSHRGDFRTLTASIASHLTKFPDSKTAWIARPDQVSFLQPHDVIHQTDNPTLSESFVGGWIREAVQNGHAGSVFHVFSYNPRVLAVAAALNDATLLVTTDHLGNLRDDRHGVFTSASKAAPASGFGQISLDEATAVAKAVLRAGGHTSRENAMHQPMLRPLMVRKDPRARRIQEDRRTWPLIRELVDLGQRQGWLQQERRGPTGYEYVWLVEPVGVTPTGSMSIDSTKTEPTGTEQAKSSEEPPAQTKPKKLDKQFEDILREQRISSQPVARKFCWDAFVHFLPDVDASTEVSAVRPTLSVLLSDVAVKAKEFASQAAAQLATGVLYQKEPNWRATVECVGNAMLQAGVVLEGDKPVPSGIGSPSSRPTSLDPNFRLRTLALMVERIIQKRGCLLPAEVHYLGLTLFQQGPQNPIAHEKLVADVDAILKMLLDENRIKVTDDGAITPLTRVV